MWLAGFMASLPGGSMADVYFLCIRLLCRFWQWHHLHLPSAHIHTSPHSWGSKGSTQTFNTTSSGISSCPVADTDALWAQCLLSHLGNGPPSEERGRAVTNSCPGSLACLAASVGRGACSVSAANKINMFLLEWVIHWLGVPACWVNYIWIYPNRWWKHQSAFEHKVLPGILDIKLLSGIFNFFFTIIIWENLCVSQKTFLKGIMLKKRFKSDLFNPYIWSSPRENFVSALRLPFFISLSQVAKLAAVYSGLPFVCITVYAATEKESKSQLVKPDKVWILLFVDL